MTPFQEGNSMFYNITLKNDKDEINATIDYYNNGKNKRNCLHCYLTFSRKENKTLFHIAIPLL